MNAHSIDDIDLSQSNYGDNIIFSSRQTATIIQIGPCNVMDGSEIAVTFLMHGKSQPVRRVFHPNGLTISGSNHITSAARRPPIDRMNELNRIKAYGRNDRRIENFAGHVGTEENRK